MSSYACDNVEVFAAGTHRGKAYTVADLDQMVRNFNQFSTGAKPLLSPPAVLGHEEDQQLLENSGLPAAGWITKLWRHGDKLKAKVSGIPEKVAKLINQHSYRKVSAEIYDEPPEGIPGQGMMLRRLALLGAEIPQVKTLADLPPAQLDRYKERAFGILRSQPAPLTFSEDRPMMPDLAGIAAKLESYGVKPEDTLKAVQELGPLFTGEAPAAEPAAPMADPAPEAEPAFDRNAAIQELVAAGHDPAMLEGMSDEELQAKLAELKSGAAPMADPTPATPAPVKPAAPTNPVQAQPKSITMKYAEEQKALEAKFAKLKANADALEKVQEQAKKEAKAALINAFVEQMRQGKEVRVLPAEEPTVRALLEKCDHLTVQKFSENGQTVEKTELQRQMDLIRAWPVKTKLGEGHLPGRGAPQADDAKARVSKFYESNAAQFRVHGTSKETFLAGWEAAQKRGVPLEQYCPQA